MKRPWVAVGLGVATWLTYNRCMGRITLLRWSGEDMSFAELARRFRRRAVGMARRLRGAWPAASLAAEAPSGESERGA
jgi:hypothetical protein